ncbi:UNKNOWN [Stylonychia lemnae]|uniref:Phosphoglycerate mutase family protein n=1 Tax=Stylonychia lemnae TaxID=5949 RepID=A0A078B7E3_STYLE|nr:UNKNOWN [Stylonychia lemnae]|eukprot:CDW90334.1 UNKNOWN [Stylonychia lemnae]
MEEKDDQTLVLEQARKDQEEGVKNPHLNIDVNFVAPAPNPELVAKNRFVLIRHGVTDFNWQFSEVVGKYGFSSLEFRDLKVDTQYIDIQLREEGVIQCEKSQSHASQINFRYVIVSQMVRACQTAIHIFKNHPNKDKIKFIVIPLVKEGLNTGNDKCGTYERMRKIIDPLVTEHNLHFDFSMMHTFGLPDLIQIKVTTELDRLQEFYEYISEDGKCEINGHSEQLLKITYDRFPYRLEGPYEMYVRGIQFRKFLKHFINNLDLKEDDKIAVVSHSAFLSSLSCKGFDREKQLLVEPAQIFNCQFVPWETYEEYF